MDLGPITKGGTVGTQNVSDTVMKRFSGTLHHSQARESNPKP